MPGMCPGASVDCPVLGAGKPVHIAGLPAISLPLPSRGVLQIVGRPGGDGELLQLAADLMGESCVSP
jgi:Asp-tRNA(Asn)/Glu-tRNA(Gln) amidotransferase A subunit family amidase